jgi:hypothetical protein
MNKIETLLGNQKVKRKSRGIAGLIASGLLLAGTFGLVTYSISKVTPTISENVEQRKLKKDYDKALENYSREMYLSGQENAPAPTFSSDVELFNFIKAYSQ